MIFKKKPLMIGRYPSCDHLNIAIRYLLNDVKVNRKAIVEICHAIRKAKGYFYDDVRKKLIEAEVLKR